MRITKPLIGTAAGAAVLGATLALGLSMASASTSLAGDWDTGSEPIRAGRQSGVICRPQRA